MRDGIATIAWRARMLHERGLARQCLDCTERTHRLGGPLGVALLEAFSDLGWLRRSRETRAIQVTLKGQFELRQQLGVEVHFPG